jgi:PPOX class probable F420-dependent enzyme
MTGPPTGPPTPAPTSSATSSPLDDASLALIAEARRGVLVTTDHAGRPRPTPFCYVARTDAAGRLVLDTPIDDKPKRSADPLKLPRILDIARSPEVVVLVDRWDEDWSRLAWIRLRGTATVLTADDASATTERATAIATLRVKYPQYATHALEERPIIRIAVDSWAAWWAARSTSQRRRKRATPTGRRQWVDDIAWR